MAITVTPSSVLDVFSSMREYPILRHAAVVSGQPLTIRGGVVRNMVLTHRYDRKPADSLFDYVDPLSDVDVMVEQPSHWPTLAHVIGQELPVARYFRWEPRTVSDLHRVAAHFERIPAERLAITIPPVSSARPELNTPFGGTDADLRKLLDQVNSDEVVDRAWFEEMHGLPHQDLVTSYLRILRVALQYDMLLPDEQAALLQAIRSRPSDAASGFEGDLVSFRLIVQVLDILFTALNLEKAANRVRALLTALPASLGRFANLLKTYDFLNLTKHGGHRRIGNIGALVYPSAPARMPSIQLLGGANYSRGSIVPWTAVDAPEPNCCPLVDFSHGVATLVWRSVVQPYLPVIPVAVLAPFTPRSPLLSPEGLSAAEQSALTPVALPMMLSTRAAHAVRMDHAYVARLTGEATTFHVGLVDLTTILGGKQQ